MDTLTGATALVTGASGGIGSHLATALTQGGARVVLSARSVAALEALSARLRDSGAEVAVVPADLTEPREVDGLVARAEAALGPLDVLINNAGVEITASYTALAPDELRGMTALNLAAPMVLTRQALPGMLARGRGHVVNIASIAGKGPTAYDVPYAATKAGLIGLTRSLRSEYRDTPVGFSAICPGFVEHEGMYARMRALGLKAPRALTAVPLADVAAAVLTAIEQDRPEIIVTRRPLRPLAVAGEIRPELLERAAATIGATRFMRSVAKRQGRLVER
jgi:short-subunit dehydrogenase